MKKLTFSALLIGAVSLSANGFTTDNSPAATTMAANPAQTSVKAAVTTTATTVASPVMQKVTPMATVLQNLLASGYVAVKKLKYEGGVYKGEAIDVQGREVDVRIDPETGKVIEPKATARAITVVEAVNKVEAAGYHNVHEVEVEKDNYDVKALDKDGAEAKLKVDVYSGKVSKKWF